MYRDPDDAILFDRCERCRQHADGILSLDPDTLGRLWTRMVEVERNGDDLYRTNTERHACSALYRIAVLIERTHPGIDPWTWPWTDRRGRSLAQTIQIVNT